MPKTTTISSSGSTLTTVTDIDGTKTTVTTPVIQPTIRGNEIAKVGYKTHKVWNPNTSAYLTVTCTGSEAQDATLLAAAFVTAGVRSDSVISSTV